MTKSIEIKNQILTIDDRKKSPARSANASTFSLAHINELMSDLEMTITKLMFDLKDDGSILAELRDHIVDVYQKVGVGLLKRHIVYEEMLQK